MERGFLFTAAAAAAMALLAGTAAAADLRQTAQAINATIRANHFRPAELDSDAYRKVEADVIALGGTATSDEGDGFLGPLPGCVAARDDDIDRATRAEPLRALPTL